jgi:hypothetical protein
MRVPVLQGRRFSFALWEMMDFAQHRKQHLQTEKQHLQLSANGRRSVRHEKKIAALLVVKKRRVKKRRAEKP